MKHFIQSMKKFRVLWFFTIFMLFLAVASIIDRDRKATIEYKESLEEVIATVEGEPLTLRDFSIYVVHQEQEVESQALAYNYKNTNKYWNVHTNGKFVKFMARDSALGMAIHDALFYQLAEEMGLSLNDEEQVYVANDVMDFWTDLVESGKVEKLGITEEDVKVAYEKIALAEKAQFIYAQIDNVEYENYNYGKEEYESFLSDYEYKVDEAILERLDFGDITLDH